MGKRYYSGYYKPRKKSKYIGNKRSIVYRSLWERSFCKWCDTNSKVMKWAIEPMHINYFDRGNNKHRKYYPDFYVKMDNGIEYLIEIKPHYQTQPPKMKKHTKKYINENKTYMTNTSKWESAVHLCNEKGWTFKIITERVMESMGIKIMKSSDYKQIKKGTSKKKVKYTNSASSGLLGR